MENQVTTKDYSWNSIRQSHSRKPIEVKKRKSSPRKVEMQRKALSPTMVTIHFKDAGKSITLNKWVSVDAYNKGLEYLTYGERDGKSYIFLSKTKEEFNEPVATVCYNGRGKTPQGTVHNSFIVGSIAKYFGMTKGDYILSVKQIESKDDTRYMVLELTDIVNSQPTKQADDDMFRTCPKCGRTLPVSEFYPKSDGEGHQSYCKDCCKAHGRLRNGTTGEYREESPVTEEMIEKVIVELKKRGYKIMKPKPIEYDEL